MSDLAVRHRLQLISIAFSRRRSRSLHWLLHLPRPCCLRARPLVGLLRRRRFAVFLEMVVMLRCFEFKDVVGCCRSASSWARSSLVEMFTVGAPFASFLGAVEFKGELFAAGSVRVLDF